jgi:hypothetical protein
VERDVYGRRASKQVLFATVRFWFTWLDRSRSLTAGFFDPRLYVMPPGVLRDRVRAVEAAFLKTLKDLEFVAEAEKTRMTLNPIPSATLQQNDHRRLVHDPGIRCWEIEESIPIRSLPYS